MIVIKDSMSTISSIFKRFIFIAVILVIVLTGLSFALLNSTPVSFNYYIGKQDLPLSLLLVLSLVLGAILGVAASFGLILKSRTEISKIRREVKSKTKELTNLQSLTHQENQ